ncbi:MAG TPA: YbjN domain-containing protein [Actinomycetota bacterium]|jgi:hypothetical protein
MTDEAVTPKPDDAPPAPATPAPATPAPAPPAHATPAPPGEGPPGPEDAAGSADGSPAGDHAELTPEQRYPKPRPEGEPEKIVAVRETIETRLGAMFELYLVDQHGNYVLGLDSARVFVVPTWLENGATVVRVFAITNLDVPVTAELTSYLLAKNLDFVFGGFALDVDNGAVWFNHNVLGDFMTGEELEATLSAVAQTANQFDDEIKGRFGGRLYVETPDQAVPTPATPGYL